MSDLFHLLVEVASYLWPFRIVWHWEAGAYYICGRYAFQVPRGCWPVVPFFFDVKTVNMVADVFSTEEQTVEMQDGGTLTFTASVRMRVTDPALALNNVVDHEENAVEDVAAVLAETLADMPPERLDPAKRRGLLRKCELEVNKLLGEYGMEVERIRFTNYLRNIRAYRLITSGNKLEAE